MPTLEVTILATLDGAPLAGFPLTRRIALTEVQSFDYQKSNDGNTTTYTSLPINLASLQALIARADQAVTLRLNGQSDKGVALNQYGVLIVLDGSINAGAATNATVNNNSGVAADVRGVVGGA